MSTMPIELYTDGSSLHNPGPSGLAYIIRYWTDNDNGEMPQPNIIEGSQGFRLSTNNRMEILAGIYGIKRIIEDINNGNIKGNYTQINLSSDSEYFCNAVNQRWIQKWVQNNWMTSGFKGSAPKSVKNKDLWEQIIELQEKLQSMGITLTLIHIKGHNGHEFNEKADKLAVTASNTSTNHLIDECYEKTLMDRR